MSEYYTIVNKSANKYGDSADIVSTVIAPLTAQYTEIPPTTSSEKAKLEAAAASRIQLPTEFDPRKTVLKNKTRVLDQASCGSCWAFSTATAMSDTFSRISNEEVFLDPMSVILGAQADASFTQQTCKNPLGTPSSLGNGCNGAAPLQVSMCLGGYTGPEVASCECSQWSLTEPTCQDYSSYLSVCSGDPKCSSLPPKTRSKIINKAFTDLNTTDKGFKNGGVQGLCFRSPSKGKMFKQFRLTMPDNTWFTKILQGQRSGQAPLPTQDGIYNAIKHNQERMKELIYTNGTLVGGMPVFMDFMSGGAEGKVRHSSSGQKIELTTSSWFDAENGKIYVGGGCIDPTTVDGGHAVCIVGWGNSKNLEKYVKTRLPWITQEVIQAVESVGGSLGDYWIMRNSWGSNWGQDGYWLNACYPGNLYAQFSYSYILPPTVWSMLQPGDVHLKIPTKPLPPPIFGGQWVGLKADKFHPKNKLDVVDEQKYEDMIKNIYKHPPSSVENAVGSLIGEKIASRGLEATQGNGNILSIANEIYQPSTEISISFPPSSPSSPSPSLSTESQSNHTALIVIIIIIVLLVVLGIGYFLWRRSKQK